MTGMNDKQALRERERLRTRPSFLHFVRSILPLKSRFRPGKVGVGDGAGREFGFGTRHVSPEDRHRFPSVPAEQHLFAALLGDKRDPDKLTPPEQIALGALEAYSARLRAWLRDNRRAFDRATTDWKEAEARITQPSEPKTVPKGEMPKGTDLHHWRGEETAEGLELLYDASGNLPVVGRPPDEERANLKVLAKALHKQALPIVQRLKKCSAAEWEALRAGADAEDEWIFTALQPKENHPDRPWFNPVGVDTPWRNAVDLVANELSQRTGREITEGMVRGYLRED